MTKLIYQKNNTAALKSRTKVIGRWMSCLQIISTRINQSTWAKTNVVLHGCHITWLWELVEFIIRDDFRCFAKLIIPKLECQCDTCHADTHENNNEYTTDILDWNTIRLILWLLAFCRNVVFLPPAFLEFLQLTLVEELEDAENERNLFDYGSWLCYEDGICGRSKKWNISALTLRNLRVIEIRMQRSLLLWA